MLQSERPVQDGDGDALQGQGELTAAEPETEGEKPNMISRAVANLTKPFRRGTKKDLSGEEEPLSLDHPSMRTAMDKEKQTNKPEEGTATMPTQKEGPPGSTARKILQRGDKRGLELFLEAYP